MANILVLGVDPDSTYALAREAIVAGHNACVAISRQHAFRKLLSGLVDTLMLDCALDAPAQAEIFRQLRRAVPSVPRCIPKGARLPVITREVPTTVLPRRRPELSEGLMRAVAYLFGIAEGRRLGVPTDIEIVCDGVTRFSALTTALQNREAVIEFLDPDAQDALLGITLLGSRVPAVAKLHFPGGGVLRVEGTVEAAVGRRGVTALKLTASDDAADRPAEIERPEPAIAASMLHGALLSA